MHYITLIRRLFIIYNNKMTVYNLHVVENIILNLYSPSTEKSINK